MFECLVCLDNIFILLSVSCFVSIILDRAKLDPRVQHENLIASEYNQTATFSLNVIAHPVPTYNWSRLYNKRTMPLLSKSVVISEGLTSNLTIPMTAKTDIVTYISQVENTIGSEIFTFQLVAAGRCHVIYF